MRRRKIAEIVSAEIKNPELAERTVKHPTNS
jgi:hypothetical protein